MKASRVSRMKVTRTPGRLLRRLYCVRFLEDTNGKIKKANVVWQMGRAHEGRSAADCRARSRSPRDQPQNLAGGKSRRSARPHPVDVCVPTNCGAPFSTLPESLMSFTVHRRAHLPAFHSHFLTAHNIGTVFLNFSLNHIFFFLTAHKYTHRVSQFFSLNQIFFCLSHYGTVSRAKFPVRDDDDGFKLFTSLVHCASQSTSSSTQTQERLERWFYSIVDGFVWGKVSCQ